MMNSAGKQEQEQFDSLSAYVGRGVVNDHVFRSASCLPTVVPSDLFDHNTSIYCKDMWNWLLLRPGSDN